MAVPKRMRFEVFRRDGFRCTYCGSGAAEGATLVPDHVVPEALGGPTRPDNLTTACEDCNQGKASTSPNEVKVAEVSEGAKAMAKEAAQVYALLSSQVAALDEYLAGIESTGITAGAADGWYTTISRWHDQGIPLEVVQHCAKVAMDAARIPTANKFRYACGVLKNMVGDVPQARAEVAVKAECYGHIHPFDLEEGVEPCSCEKCTARSEGSRAGFRAGVDATVHQFYLAAAERAHVSINSVTMCATCKTDSLSVALNSRSDGLVVARHCDCDEDDLLAQAASMYWDFSVMGR